MTREQILLRLKVIYQDLGEGWPGLEHMHTEHLVKVLCRKEDLLARTLIQRAAEYQRQVAEEIPQTGYGTGIGLPKGRRLKMEGFKGED